MQGRPCCTAIGRSRASCAHRPSTPKLEGLHPACCRRKQREARKFSKAVQAERVKEKAQSRKAGVDALTRLRKQRQRQGFAGGVPPHKEQRSKSLPRR